MNYLLRVNTHIKIKQHTNTILNSPGHLYVTHLGKLILYIICLLHKTNYYYIIFFL